MKMFDRVLKHIKGSKVINKAMPQIIKTIRLTVNNRSKNKVVKFIVLDDLPISVNKKLIEPTVIKKIMSFFIHFIRRPPTQ